MNDAGCSPCHRKTTDCTWVYDTNFAHLAFYYIEHELYASKALVAIYWMHLRVNLICICFLLTKIQ